MISSPTVPHRGGRHKPLPGSGPVGLVTATIPGRRHGYPRPVPGPQSFDPPAAASASTAVLVAAVAALADHLRRLPESRLRRRHDELGGATAAEAAHRLAQWLADEAARWDAGEGPVVLRAVPRLSDLAVGDQVAVTGQELVDRLADRRQPEAIRATLAEALERVAEVRRHA